MACGGMEPSEVIVQDNLHEAPASAHTVSTSDITIKFWFDVTPPRNSVIAPGTGTATYTMFCRHSRYLTNPSLYLHLEFDHIASDGSASLFTPFGNSRGLATFSCGSTASSGGGSPIPAAPTFAGLREVRVSAWILSDEELDALRASRGSPARPPDGVFVEALNWTAAPPVASPPKLFESATLGPTGASGGFVLDGTHFVGVRFTLSSPTIVSTIGIHAGIGLAAGGLFGTIFGAVVQLTDLSDFPDSLDLSTPDVLGSVLISGTPGSADYSSSLSLSLPAGTYGLVFGGGLFGAGVGAVPRNDSNIGSPSYFQRVADAWRNDSIDNTRMFVD